MRRRTFAISFCLIIIASIASGREITFCGEAIPINNEFVAKKLMNVIRQQIGYIDLPRMRREAQRYFPMIQYMLRQCNMPDDLKYIPIIESGFRNATSVKGAQGFWQLMEKTAIQWGLTVNPQLDERNDIYKSTIAALCELAQNFRVVKRQYNISSWILTAAAYNWGSGNLCKKLKGGNSDYFAMQLNPETAVYVYKIVAIKELFEYPELYIKNFQYNVFNSNSKKVYDPKQPNYQNEKTMFEKMDLKGREDGKTAPDDGMIKQISKPTEAELKKQKVTNLKQEARLVYARIIGKYKDFKDGDEIIVELRDDLESYKGLQRKGTQIVGRGWLIENRVFIDLGFDSSNVILYDTNSEQGVALSELKNKEQVILRVQN
jgi:membrane-bound lytic murein transglycosylase D